MSIDSDIKSLVDALNAAGIETVASCSGHGKRPGNIALADGRELIICNSYKVARAIDKILPSINSDIKYEDIELTKEDWKDLYSTLSRYKNRVIKRYRRSIPGKFGLPELHQGKQCNHIKRRK